MAASPERAPYRPHPEQVPLFPEVSGNDINGLGERAPRRPTPIYWHRSEQLAHGALQQWMIKRFLAEPDLANVHERFGGRGPSRLDPVAPEHRERAPADWANQVKAFALAHEADLVSVAACLFRPSA